MARHRHRIRAYSNSSKRIWIGNLWLTFMKKRTFKQIWRETLVALSTKIRTYSCKYNKVYFSISLNSLCLPNKLNLLSCWWSNRLRKGSSWVTNKNCLLWKTMMDLTLGLPHKSSAALIVKASHPWFSINRVNLALVLSNHNMVTALIVEHSSI